MAKNSKTKEGAAAAAAAVIPMKSTKDSKKVKVGSKQKNSSQSTLTNFVTTSSHSLRHGLDSSMISPSKKKKKSHKKNKEKVEARDSSSTASPMKRKNADESHNQSLKKRKLSHSDDNSIKSPKAVSPIKSSAAPHAVAHTKSKKSKSKDDTTDISFDTDDVFMKQKTSKVTHKKSPSKLDKASSPKKLIPGKHNVHNGSAMDMVSSIASPKSKFASTKSCHGSSKSSFESARLATVQSPSDSRSAKPRKEEVCYGPQNGSEMDTNGDDDQEMESGEYNDVDERNLDDMEEYKSVLHPDDMDDGSGWSKNQMDALVHLLKEKLGKETITDKLSFRRRIKSLQWGTIPQELVPPRTKEQCTECLQKIVSNISSVRNLSEMLNAYVYKKPSKRANKVMSALERFRLDNMELIKEKGGNMFQTAKILFEALPEEERLQKYVMPFKKEKAEIKDREMSIAAAATPMEHYAKKHPCDDRKELKERYSSLSKKKKLKYIKLAMADYNRSLAAYNELMKTCPQEALKDLKEPFLRIKRDDIRLLLISMGMPEIKAASPLRLYQQQLKEQNGEEEAAGTSKGSALGAYIAFLRSPYFQPCTEEFFKLQQEFSEAFNAWKPTLTDPTLQKQASLYYNEVMATKGTVKKKQQSKFVKTARARKEPKGSTPKVKVAKEPKLSKPKIVATKVQELEEDAVEPSFIASFQTDPKPPPMTAKECFKFYLKDKSQTEITSAYQKLSAIQKQQCSLAAKANVNKYKQQLKDFVAGLSENERYIYLGQNRVRLVRLFEGIDIFEKDYPVCVFPTFKKRTKQDTERSVNETTADVKVEVGLSEEELARVVEAISSASQEPLVTETVHKEEKSEVEGDDSENEEEEEEGSEVEGDNSENGEESEDDEQNDEAMTVAAVNETAFRKKVLSSSTPMAVKADSDSGQEEMESSDDEEGKKLYLPVTNKINTRTLKKDSSSEDEEDEEPGKKEDMQVSSSSHILSIKKSPVSPMKSSAPEESSDTSSSESSDSPTPQPPSRARGNASTSPAKSSPAKRAVAAAADSSSSEDSDSDSEEETAAPQQVRRQQDEEDSSDEEELPSAWAV